jgi:FixJ family two-component response regulator
MARGRPLPSLTLSDEERRTLQGWTRRRTTAQALAQRARVVLECATGKPNRTVARELRLDEDTIGKWRQRFVDRRLMACSMSRGRARHERSPMNRLRTS